MKRFLVSQYPSKVFMPAIGAKTATFHRWADCGYIHFDKPGTGRSVFLTGKEILYARCLVLLSEAGHSHSQMHLRGLKECIAFFEHWLFQNDDELIPTLSDTYALFKFVEGRLFIDGEWEMTSDPLGKWGHITEGHGDRAAPYVAMINLTEALKELVLKIGAPAD